MGPAWVLLLFRAEPPSDPRPRIEAATSVSKRHQVLTAHRLRALLTRRLPPKGRASPRRQGLRVTGGPSFSHERGLAGRLISAYSRSFPPDNPLLLWA